MSDIEVRHDREARRFFTVIDGKEAYLAYADAGDGTLDYRHTFVPPALRGRQVAKLLVAAAFDHARANDLRVIPTCSYVAKQVERHPEYRELTVRATG
ncbi:MAG: GNAT family N-acetyltransferase [Gemmatimonadales bacterium]|jgi:predicted GNAT family acetyltransferase